MRTVTLHLLDDPAFSLAKGSVYFDDDSVLIHASAGLLVKARAKYLALSRTAMASIEGDADRRRGRENCLTLGQKRTEAVPKLLQMLRVHAGEMDAVSFSKNRLIDPEHDETVWTKNGRAGLNANLLFSGERGRGDQAASLMEPLTPLISAARMG